MSSKRANVSRSRSLSDIAVMVGAVGVPVALVGMSWMMGPTGRPRQRVADEGGSSTPAVTNVDFATKGLPRYQVSKPQ